MLAENSAVTPWQDTGVTVLYTGTVNQWLLNCIFQRHYCALWFQVSACNKQLHVCDPSIRLANTTFHKPHPGIWLNLRTLVHLGTKINWLDFELKWSRSWIDQIWSKIHFCHHTTLNDDSLKWFRFAIGGSAILGKNEVRWQPAQIWSK